MPTPFPRTNRSLEAERRGRSLLALAAAAALLAAWLAWFGLARISLYEVSPAARLEVGERVHPLVSEVAGRITAEHRLALGATVERGEILVELDAEAEELALAEERSRLAALVDRIAALREELAAEERALEEVSRGIPAVLAEARAKRREAEAAARLAEQEHARAERLHAQGIASTAQLDRARAEADQRRASAQSLALAVERLEREQQGREAIRAAEVEERRGELGRLEGAQRTLQAAERRLAHEIERRRLRAPVAGRVAEVTERRVGAVVEAGERLGSIVPEGAIRAVAEFPPQAALGRIRPGLVARVRLEGFPWAQYGSLGARVSGVASEGHDGSVRVELALDPDPASPIPLEHGLPGSVEVEVERITPAALVLRLAGRLLARPVAIASP